MDNIIESLEMGNFCNRIYGTCLLEQGYPKCSTQALCQKKLDKVGDITVKFYLYVTRNASFPEKEFNIFLLKNIKEFQGTINDYKKLKFAWICSQVGLNQKDVDFMLNLGTPYFNFVLMRLMFNLRKINPLHSFDSELTDLC